MNVSEISRYWKTVVAGLGLLATLIQAIVADPTVAAAAADNTITDDEWWRIAIAAVTTLFVYGIPNKPPAGALPRPDLSEQG